MSTLLHLAMTWGVIVAVFVLGILWAAPRWYERGVKDGACPQPCCRTPRPNVRRVGGGWQ